MRLMLFQYFPRRALQGVAGQRERLPVHGIIVTSVLIIIVEPSPHFKSAVSADGDVSQIEYLAPSGLVTINLLM